MVPGMDTHDKHRTDDIELPGPFKALEAALPPRGTLERAKLLGELSTAASRDLTSTLRRMRQQAVLDLDTGNRGQLAEQLGISYTTLHNIIHGHGRAGTVSRPLTKDPSLSPEQEAVSDLTALGNKWVKSATRREAGQELLDMIRKCGKDPARVIAGARELAEEWGRFSSKKTIVNTLTRTLDKAGRKAGAADES